MHDVLGARIQAACRRRGEGRSTLPLRGVRCVLKRCVSGVIAPDRRREVVFALIPRRNVLERSCVHL